jgi:hypothetical protein
MEGRKNAICTPEERLLRSIWEEQNLLIASASHAKKRTPVSVAGWAIRGSIVIAPRAKKKRQQKVR